MHGHMSLIALILAMDLYVYGRFDVPSRFLLESKQSCVTRPNRECVLRGLLLERLTNSKNLCDDNIFLKFPLLQGIRHPEPPDIFN